MILSKMKEMKEKQRREIKEENNIFKMGRKMYNDLPILNDYAKFYPSGFIFKTDPKDQNIPLGLKKDKIFKTFGYIVRTMHSDPELITLGVYEDDLER